ncbi:MAG: DNA-directed RNA polymerase subunit K [Methanobacteriota archaeon]
MSHTLRKGPIVGARTLQIEMGAPVLVELPEKLSDPIDIAMYEYDKDAIPITVVRRLPGESRASSS